MKFFGVDERFVGKRKYDVTCGRTNFPVYWAREATMEKAYFEDDETSFLVVWLTKEIGKAYYSFICLEKDYYVLKKYYELLGYKK